MSRLLMSYNALKYTCRVLDVLVGRYAQWRISQMAEVVHLHKPQTHYFKSRFLYMTRANILTGPESLNLLQGVRGGLKEAIEFGLSLNMIVLLRTEL